MSNRGESKLSLELDANGEAIDDDPRTITLSYTGEGARAPSSPLLKGMDLDLSAARDRKGFSDEEDHRRKGVQEEEVIVIFELPDGSQGENQVNIG